MPIPSSTMPDGHLALCLMCFLGSSVFAFRVGLYLIGEIDLKQIYLSLLGLVFCFLAFAAILLGWIA